MRHAVAAKVALVSVVLLLGLIASPGAIRHFILAVAAPRPVEPRGDSSEMEHSIIASFERVSPSVVQIAGSVPHSPSSAGEDEIQSGTGFVWDTAGNIVTNDHVVENTRELLIRFGNGEVTKARIVGIA